MTIRTINCYGRLNVLFLREKCAHSTLPITIFICIYLFFFFFLSEKNMLFQFYSWLSLYWFDHFGESFFFCFFVVASSRGEANPLVKYLWDFLSATVFRCCLVAVFCFSFFFFYCKENVGGFLFYIILGLVRQEQFNFSFCFPRPLATTNAHQ